MSGSSARKSLRDNSNVIFAVVSDVFIRAYTMKKIIFCLGLLAILQSILILSLACAQTSLKRTYKKTVQYTSEGLRDPFESPFEMEMEAIPTIEPEPKVTIGLPHLKVQGMIWASERPQAIINHTVVRVGEIIEGAEILDIRREGIYLLYQGRQYIVRPGMPRK